MYILHLFLGIVAICYSAQSSNDFRASNSITTGVYLPINLVNSSSGEISYYREVTLPAYSTNEFSIRNIASSFGFAIFQVHACLYNVTLSYNLTLKPNMHVHGSDLGLMVYPSALPQSLFIFNENYFSSINVSIAVVVYNPTIPLPGACNLAAAEVEDSPGLLVQNSREMISVYTPPAAMNVNERLCPTQPPSALQYSGFHLYLPKNDFSCRTYFDGIKRMMTATDVRKNGKLGNAVPRDYIRRTYISLPGTGIVFASLVQGTQIEDVAAYVPAYSISCSPTFWETNCNIFSSPEYRVFTAILIVVGVIRGYFGSKAKFVGCVIDGFVVGLFGAFFVMYYCVDDYVVSENAMNYILMASGSITALIICGIWYFCKPLRWLATSMSNVIVGYLLGSFSLFVIESPDLKSSTWWWEGSLVAGILITFVFLPPCWSWSGILLSASWGMFAIVQGMMFLTGSHGSYMVINPIRLASTRDYIYANSTPPLGSEDVWLYFAWVLLMISAVWVQFKTRQQCPTSDLNNSDERTPLIARWTNGSDDVFESPATNNRFLARIRRLRPGRLFE